MGLLEKDSLLPVTANAKMLAQALAARNQPRKQLTGQGLLDTAAIGLSPVPIVGDALGLAADASRFYNEPESRTPLNFGLAALGMLPFVPSGVGAVKKMTQYEKAHEVAQRNAALPVEKGGLGLPPNNTAMDRAKAMGFEGGWYHGTTHDFDKFGGKTHSKEGHLGAGHYFTNSPLDASANYAGVGPDLTGRLEREAESILSRKGVDWRSADDPAYVKALEKAKGKLKGDSEGLVIPAMVRSNQTIDISPSSKQYVDFTPKFNKDGDIVRENKNAVKMYNYLNKKGIDAGEALQNLDLFDAMRASDIDSSLRKSEPLMYAEGRNGDIIGNDLIRGLYKALGYDAVKMDAKAAFPNMANIPAGTNHLIVNNPNQVRSRFAAFDPMRRNENNLLANVAPFGLAGLLGIGLYDVKQGD